MDEKAGLDLSVLRGAEHIETGGFQIPKAVSPQCSFVRGRAGWVVTTSGGVDINAFGVVQKQKTDDSVGETRRTALASTDKQWWWDK